VELVAPVAILAAVVLDEVDTAVWKGVGGVWSHVAVEDFEV
jgi:hypothetical protein